MMSISPSLESEVREIDIISLQVVEILWKTSELRLLALRKLLFTLYLYSGLRPSAWGKVTSDN